MTPLSPPSPTIIIQAFIIGMILDGSDMAVPIVPPNDRSNDPSWCFLAEFSISDFIANHDPNDEARAGLLFQAVRALGMTPERIETIERTLAESAKEALAHSEPGSVKVPGRIRVFCQRKVINDVNAARAASHPYPKEQAKEPASKVLDADMKRNGGWGYFIVERGADFSPGAFASPHTAIDLYLYKEGI